MTARDDKRESLPAEATHEMLMAAKKLRSFYSLDDYAAIWRVMVKAFTPSHARQNAICDACFTPKGCALFGCKNAAPSNVEAPQSSACREAGQNGDLRTATSVASTPSTTACSGELLIRLRNIARSRRNLKFAITEQETRIDLKGDLQMATRRAKQNLDDDIFALIDADFDLDAALETTPSATECIPLDDIREQIDHIEKNGIDLKQFGGQHVDEGRCRELCAMYLREFITGHGLQKQIAALNNRADGGKA